MQGLSKISTHLCMYLHIKLLLRPNTRNELYDREKQYSGADYAGRFLSRGQILPLYFANIRKKELSKCFTMWQTLNNDRIHFSKSSTGALITALKYTKNHLTTKQYGISLCRDHHKFSNQIFGLLRRKSWDIKLGVQGCSRLSWLAQDNSCYTYPGTSNTE